MNKRTILGALCAMVVTTASIAAEFPSYYPQNGLQATGRINALHLEENRIVIDDVSYQMTDSPIVHALNAYSVSFGRIRPGVMVAFLPKQGNVISEFWLLPLDYDPRERRQ